MKWNVCLLYLCVCTICTTQSYAYEINTHAVITQQTVGRTVLSDNNFLQELGVDEYNNNLGLMYYDISVGDVRERSNDNFEDDIIKNDFGEKLIL